MDMDNDFYGSHLWVLKTLMDRLAPERVLEFGMGMYSTPLFIEYPITLVSVEMDSLQWLCKIAETVFQSHRNVRQFHPVFLPAAIAPKILAALDKPDLVFVDGSDNRAEQAAAALNVGVKTVVMHDYSYENHDYAMLRVPPEYNQYICTRVSGPPTGVFTRLDLGELEVPYHTIVRVDSVVRQDAHAAGNGNDANCFANSPLWKKATLSGELSWPATTLKEPTIRPEGYMDCGVEHLLCKYVNRSTQLVLELGAGQGLTAWRILSLSDRAALISVDPFAGEGEDLSDQARTDVSSRLAEICKFNLHPFRERVRIVKSAVIKCMQNLKASELAEHVQVVLVDVVRDLEHVVETLIAIRAACPNAVVIGNEWSRPHVKRAVIQMSTAENSAVEGVRNGWYLGLPGSAIQKACVPH